MLAEDIVIQCDHEKITMNGKEISFPLPVSTLIEIIGKPTHQYYLDHQWQLIWDNYGIYADSVGLDTVYYLQFLFTPEPRLKHLPLNVFSGTVVVNGQRINDVKDETIKLGKSEVRKLRFEGRDENVVYAFMLTKNFDYKEEVEKNKYVLPRSTKNSINFTDFNFKLIVIEELMYRQKLLKPQFDVYEFVEQYNRRKIDIEKEGYDIIPEVFDYFNRLEIDKTLANKVTELYQDGANEIYAQLHPFWDGEDRTFEIQSYEDIKHFPNLKKMTLFPADEKTFEAIRSKGIEVKSF